MAAKLLLLDLAKDPSPSTIREFQHVKGMIALDWFRDLLRWH